MSGTTLRNFTVCETTGRYTARRPLTETQIITAAKRLIARRVIRKGPCLTSPETTRNYFIVMLGAREQEVFAAAFLDNRHRVIAVEELFYGTVDGATVHPREVVRRAIHHNAAALICAHNHPSGMAEPSQADRAITGRLKDALALIDVRVLDHIVIGGTKAVSFAERGMLPGVC